MSHNILNNNKQADRFEERMRIKKLQPIGRKILKTLDRETLKNGTIIFRKPSKK